MKFLLWFAPNGIGIRGCLTIFAMMAFVAATFYCLVAGLGDLAKLLVGALIGVVNMLIGFFVRDRQEHNGGKHNGGASPAPSPPEQPPGAAPTP